MGEIVPKHIPPPSLWQERDHTRPTSARLCALLHLNPVLGNRLRLAAIAEHLDRVLAINLQRLGRSDFPAVIPDVG